MSDYLSARLADAMNQHLKAEHAQFEEQRSNLIREAYALFDRYNKSKSENVQERIVTQLYNMGFVIRPMHMLIASDNPGKSEELNAGNIQWGLHNRVTRRPVARPIENKESNNE